VAGVVVGEASGVQQFVQQGMTLQGGVLGQSRMQSNGNWSRWHLEAAAAVEVVVRHLEVGVSQHIGIRFEPFEAQA